ncbi:neuropeptide SIFamide receptor-like isoform X2 [Stylophora pistillata]|nr:neuropeptide SIFamide receptor-like isoform X2 [Stylophora pistillata]
MNFSSTIDSLNNSINITSSSSSPCYVHDAFSVKLGRVIAYSVIILASLFGNIFIVSVVSRYGRRRKTINLSVVNMAIANLVITIVYMPRLIPMYLIGSVWLVEGDFGYVLCKTAPFLHTVAIIASVLTLLTSSLDTFCAVAFPLRNPFTTKVAKFAIFLIWVLAVIARVPYFIALRTKTSKGRQTCSSSLTKAFNNEDARDIYYTFLFIAFYATPWLGIFVLYLAVAFKLKTGKTPRQERTTAVRLDRLRIRAIRNIAKMMILITLVFLVCWITYFTAQITYSKVPCSFRFWRIFLAHSNCAISPILFAVYNSTVRRGIKDLVKKIRSPTKDLQENDAFRGNLFQKKGGMRRKVYTLSPTQNKGGKTPTFFHDESIILSDLSEMNRRDYTRRKMNSTSRKNQGRFELGIVNHGNQDNNRLTNGFLSFNALK